MTESQWLAERNNLQAQIDALEAARLQYRASMERYERLGRACRKWFFGDDTYEDNAALGREIYAWLLGEPKESKEAT